MILIFCVQGYPAKGTLGRIPCQGYSAKMCLFKRCSQQAYDPVSFVRVSSLFGHQSLFFRSVIVYVVLRLRFCPLLVAYCLLLITFRLLPTAYRLAPIAYCPCLLPSAFCLLPISSCLLSFAFCLLPAAYCLLHLAYCLYA